ncbi:hypothetical protein CUR178_05982 [Leishmania enriettii]|uniref:Uncharacterized protein n=1 Tax=Leishmania enriettii TaxID=5663 RepID=A0A836HSH7_LEIEN|nr:hypothetical protein CUR178_05982 [Leishmania enriettii]
MNIFESSRVDFRQGWSLADDHKALSVTRYPIALYAPGDGGTRAPLSSGIDVNTASEHSTDLQALLAAAQQIHPVAGETVQRVFPSVPYYGILSRCEVHIDVSVEQGAPSPTPLTPAGAVASAKTLLRKSVTTKVQMAYIQRRLHDVARRFGTVYYRSTCATLSESLMTPLPSNQGVPSSASAFHSQLTYGAYVDALHDAFRRFSALRQTCVEASEAASGAGTATIADGKVIHHTFYARIIRHPSWKDLSALLCVEKARLLVCLVCSSRVTQKYLTAACADAGVVLEWLGGATLMTEPLRLSPGDVNPVWVVWDALVYLPLLSPISAEREGHTDLHASGADDAVNSLESVAAGAREVLGRVLQAGAVLSGFHVSLIASIPFQGATRCDQVGRIAEEAPVFAQEGHDSSAFLAATAAAAAAPSVSAAAVVQPITRKTVVARRYVWRLIPPPPPYYPATVSTSASATAPTLSCCAVLPFFTSKLIACLVEECGLTAFTVHCGGPAEAGTHLGAPSGSAGSAASGAVGVRLVHSNAPSLLTLQQGPSSSTCLAFSRLSSAVWVDAETRESLSVGRFTAALGEPAEGAAGVEEEDTEMEFEVVSMQYERHDRLTTEDEERRRTGAGATVGVGESGSCRPVKRTRAYVADTIGEDDGDAFVQPARWGPSFHFAVAVKRLIAVDDPEE